MEFPKKLIDRLNKNYNFFMERQNYDGEPPTFVEEVDPKDLADLITYAELANARIRELQNQRADLMFKIRCVAQALK